MILDNLSNIVKTHLGQNEYNRINSSDCNFLVSDPTDPYARSSLVGADGGTTITGNKVQDYMIYLYPFLNPNLLLEKILFHTK